VLDALATLNATLLRKKSGEIKAEVKKFWPRIDSRFLSSMEDPRSKITFEAKDQDVRILAADQVAVICNLITTNELRNPPTTVQKFTFVLQNTRGSWTVQSAGAN
jgi:hypothetical protein